MAPSNYYLVLDTPGGSVDAGNSFIDFAKSLGVKIDTVTIFAASMGFHLVQNLDKRYVMNSSTLMSHRASLRLGGELGGEFDVRLNWIRRTITKMDLVVSKRVNMKYHDYTNLIRDELWLDGQDSIKYRMADNVVNVKCDSSMQGTYSEKADVMFFTVDVEWSKCPLITAPLSYSISRTALGNPANEASVKSMVSKLFYNKKEFVTEYISNTKGNQTFKEAFKIGQ